MRYAVVIEQAGNNYSAYVPDLPGCVATGATVVEVEREIRDAIVFHVEGLRDDGQAVPQPSSRVDSVGVAALLIANRPPRIIVAITGASGAIYGVRLLQALRAIGGCESHLVLSSAGGLTAQQELHMSRADIEALADVVHGSRDIGATIASGSFATLGMVVAPCSMKTLASIAHGLADNLVSRAADVVLKERRRLVLLARETPLNLAHLRNMVAVTEMGAIVAPPVPAFYTRPGTIDDLVDHTVARVLDLLELEQQVDVKRWAGLDQSFLKPRTVGAAIVDTGNP